MQEMTHNLTLDLRRLAYEHHDSCSICDYQFKEGDTSHLGYSQNGEPLYVGDCCSAELKETAVRHYFMPRAYEVPAQNARLWRYMDFTKFVSLLSSRALYFCRADKFNDPFEGAKGIVERKSEWDGFYLDFFRSAVSNPPPEYTRELSDEEIEREAQRLLKELNEGGKTWLTFTFLNCWHENAYESEAMWNLYSSELRQAIAVSTTYKDLYQALGRNPDISIGRVRYIDFNKSFAGVNNAFWRKRKSFEHEREVRAIIHDHELKGADGKLVSCCLDTLIECVHVSPTSPNWFAALVVDVMGKYGLNKSIKRSNIDAEPFF